MVLRVIALFTALVSFHISFTASAMCSRNGSLKEVKKFEASLKGILGGQTLEEGRTYTWRRSDSDKPLTVRIEDGQIQLTMSGQTVPVTKICAQGALTDVHVNFQGADAYIRIQGKHATAYAYGMNVAEADLSGLKVTDESGLAISGRAPPSQVGQR